MLFFLQVRMTMILDKYDSQFIMCSEKTLEHPENKIVEYLSPELRDDFGLIAGFAKQTMMYSTKFQIN